MRPGAKRTSTRVPSRLLLAAAIAALVLATLGALPAFAQRASSGGLPGATDPAATKHQHHGPNGEVDVNACTEEVPTRVARCLARVRTDTKSKIEKPAPRGVATPGSTLGDNGAYDPSYLQSAYNAPSTTAGSGQKVAVVDAFDDPNAETDLGAYRSNFGLAACTEANGCFQKVDQNGGTTYPPADSGWAQEISLDLDMVSAMCPNCKILLVETSSASISDLGTGVNTAASMGANAISNSYSSNEYGGETADGASYFDHPGIAVTAASGDEGYGAQFPAASQYVTAVGGTSLVQNTNGGARSGSETAWSSGGSGCSAYAQKPSWQGDKGCPNRAEADVSAVADPSTGVWVYDTYSSQGWGILGGTSVATPIVASVYALSGNSLTSDQLSSYPYEAPASALNDVTSGSNGSCGSYLCTAGSGYDGPTGLGTPNGTGAFVSPTVPAAPQKLSATAGAASVRLSWSPPSSGASGVTYDVYRSGTSGTERANNAAPIAGGLTGTTYTDGGLTNGKTYYYMVTAVSSGLHEGPPSNEAAATPSNCVTYSSSATGAHQVCGAILSKYQALGGPAGFLGYPTTDETATPDGIGRFNHFANSGSIYWTRGTGAWSIHGAIRAKWASLGWERSFLGYPTTDETATPDGIGRFNHFANSGSIYWTRGTGAWSVHGAIRAKWASMGWERSCLRYPVSDEFAIAGGRQSNFQGGAVTWSATTGVTRSTC